MIMAQLVHVKNTSERYIRHASFSSLTNIGYRQLSAQDFVKRLRNFHDFVPRKHEDMHPVRVALLDTGLRLDKKGLRLYSHRDIEVRSWLNDVAEGTPVSVGDDPCGHGTRCAIAFLQCSSATTELYVGQVFESSNSDADNTRTPRGDPGRVAKVHTMAQSASETLR
jgi:hypothetical protein